MTRLTIRIDFDQEAAIGPGKVRLLETLEGTGSIRKAAAALNMSYRRAWLLIRDIEGTMGAAIVAAKTGGTGGGGASLTKLGRKVLDHYRAIEHKAIGSVGAELRSLARLRTNPSKKTRTRLKRHRLPRRLK